MAPLRSHRPDRAWSDRRLVQACLDGDAAAWECLINKYKNLIYSVPLRYGIPLQDASDIFQGVCVELFNGLPALREIDSLPGWLATVARHRSFHWKKASARRRVHEPLSLEDTTADPAAEEVDLLASAEHDQGIRDAIGQLPPRCQRLVHLLFFEQPPRPYAAVAAELGLAQGSIGFIRGRCLKKLQRLLEQAGYA